jgi:hypothetical protein
MSTAGTTAFNLDLNDLVEEAFERAGLELRTGYDLRTARRSLNLLTIEWANRGINLWTIEQGQIPMVTGQASYPFPTNTIDLLDQVIRQNNGTTNQTDINISRISESTYSTIPNKLTQGRPIQVWINRQSGQENLSSALLATGISSTDTTITLTSTVGLASAGFIKIGTETISYPNVSGNQLLNCARGQNDTTAAAHNAGATITVQNLPSINVWPTPNSPGNQYTFVYWRLRRMQDAGTGVTEQDIPFRFLPCMVAGLAYYVAMKKPEVDGQRVLALKAAYEEQFQLAADEDRDKAPARFVPRNLFYS